MRAAPKWTSDRREGRRPGLHRGDARIIIGAKTIEQLNDNLGASGLDLSAAELASLDAISELLPEYPG